MNYQRRNAGAALFGLVATAGLAFSQVHGDRPHEHGAEVEFSIPKTYQQAVDQIDYRLHVIAEFLDSGDLIRVHSQADVIRKVGMTISFLAQNRDSGVPREAVPEVTRAGKFLSDQFKAIDAAADSGDAATTRRLYEEMLESAKVLRKYLPKVLACPMRCENDKTYRDEGKCPVCGMNLGELRAHADHSPKHGGVFFMAPDQKHHLEGTFSEHHEFRIYFYDEYTRPISAEKFTAEATVWPANVPDQESKLLLTLEPGKAFLTGKVDATVKAPLRIKVFIDFKDGQKPQVFDFEFEAPSVAPKKEPEPKAVP